MMKWRNRARFLGDIPQGPEGKVCQECRGHVAVVRVEAAILECDKPTIQKKLDMIWDFTTYAQRELYKFATCIFFTRSQDDHVEVYLDEIATAAFDAKRKLIMSLGLSPDHIPEPYELIGMMISEAIIHEWVHHEENLEEKPARFASDQLHRALTLPEWPREPPASLGHMVWSHIQCRLNKGADHPEGHVEFDECLNCMDHEKAQGCPVWELRWRQLSRRPTQPSVYHVTEITNPCQSKLEI
jgi:hypothetical protein